MIGLKRSAIGTVVERTSRYTLLVHLPRMEGYGTITPVKNGRARARRLRRTPAEVLDDQLRSIQHAGVATTG